MTNIKVELVIRSLWFSTNNPWHQDWRILGQIAKELVNQGLWANFTHFGPAGTAPLASIENIGDALRSMSRPGRWELRTQASLHYHAKVIFDVKNSHLSLIVGFSEQALSAPHPGEQNPLSYTILDRMIAFVRALTQIDERSRFQQPSEEVEVPFSSQFTMGPTIAVQVSGVSFPRLSPPAVDPDDSLSSVWTLHDNAFLSHSLGNSLRWKALLKTQMEGVGRYISLRWIDNLCERFRVVQALSDQDTWMREHLLLPRHPRFNALGDELFLESNDIATIKQIRVGDKQYGDLRYSVSRKWGWIPLQRRVFPNQLQKEDPYQALQNLHAQKYENETGKTAAIEPKRLFPIHQLLKEGWFSDQNAASYKLTRLHIIVEHRDDAVALKPHAQGLILLYLDENKKLWQVDPPGNWISK